MQHPSCLTAPGTGITVYKQRDILRVVPIVEEIADERRDIKVGKINVDEEPELANKFSIMSIPTLVVMKNGKIVQQVSGARPKNAILEML